MNCFLSGACAWINNAFVKADITVSDGKIAAVGKKNINGFHKIDCTGLYAFPGLIDVHVHLREPGFEYKETIETGTLAAAKGGFTAICAMPNLNPVPDSEEHIKRELDAISKTAKIGVFPYAAITVGENGEKLTDISALSKKAVAFSDDGHGVQSESVMLSAMALAKKYDKIIAAHCEDNTLLNGGYIHMGEYARQHNHKGICSESEWRPIKRDLELAEKTGCKYHVCHISAKESVELIRNAKKQGIDVTCETGPHYLAFSDMDLKEDGRFKMNPPIRAREDRQALIEGIKDGTIDMISTDHAPHSEEEKSRGLSGSLMGVVGIETAFSAAYTYLVKTGIISLEKLIALMHDNPMRRFGIGNNISVGNEANITLFDLEKKYTVNPKSFVSKGKSTPFDGMELFAECKMTMYKGETVWE
ncbi:MAG: dihydroorotase [Firmicutes bacterium]|nr:dihydroorotase [Bacillota bacterium]